ncbi:MAG: DUF2244 domain-containing protein [Gammaproteobacteria bacterium]
MIDIEKHPQRSEYRFVLRPNQSLSWGETRWVIGGFGMVLAAIGIWFSAQGFWLVLPFAGLELLIVWGALYAVARRCHEREVISISVDLICIEKGWRQPERQWILTRLWARVVLERCPKQWYPSRLLIRSHGRAVEVGRFLNEDERQHLAIELSRRL